MEGCGICSSLRYFSFYLYLAVGISQDSLSPGPIAYLISGSNVTFTCSTTKSWNFTHFFDYALLPDLASVIFAGNNTFCRPLFINTQFGGNKYSALPCNVGKPVKITVRNISSLYHNKTIGCSFKMPEVINTTIKIREMLGTPTINSNAIQILKEGELFNFTCTAKSIPTSQIAWHLGGSMPTGVVKISSPMENINISTLTYKARKADNKMDLFCTANDSFTAINSRYSNLNIVYVPTIHMEPSYNPYMLYEGQKNVLMTCEVVDANPSIEIVYKWHNPGGIANNSSVRINTVSKAVDGNYSCTATNAAGTSSIASKRIDVQYGPIITGLQDKNVTAGTDLSVEASIEANPSSVVVWWTRLKDNNFSANGTTLVIKNIQKKDSNNYTCNVMNILTPTGQNKQNKTTVKTFKLNVQFVPTIRIDPTFDPYILYLGQENVTLRCIVEDANPMSGITYHWKYPNGFAKGQSYNIKTVSKTDSGPYNCLAGNIIGNSSGYSMQINVQYGPTVTDLQDTNITAGTVLSVKPTINANPISSVVVWWTRLKDAAFIQNGLTLTVPNIQKQYTDTYTCNVINTLTPSGDLDQNKTAVESFFVNVQYVPTIHIAPTHEPYILYYGQENVQLRCILDDANPVNGITYHWTYKGGIAKGQTFTITTVSKSDSGKYRCLAANAIGNSSITIKEINVHYGPTISNISKQEDIVEGKNLIIIPVVDSNPMTGSVWWTKHDDASFRFDSLIFVINNIKRNSSGNYTCHSMNTLTPSGLPAMVRTSERTFYVNVQYPPSTEVVEGTSLQVREYNNVTLHCKVRAANPVITSISWNQNVNVTLSNTAEYTIGNIQRSAAGNYTCNAVNNIGIGTTLVHVSVLYGPDVKNLVVVNGSTVRENSTVVLECEIDSNPASTIEWTFNSQPKSNSELPKERSYYYIEEATCFQTGNYRCSATNTIMEQTYNASKEIQLFVKCSPRLNIQIGQPAAKIGLPIGGILNLSINIIAYPELTTAEWIFRSNSSCNITYNSTSLQSSLIRHRVQLYKENLTENDFGDYKLEVQNIVGSNKYTFHVVPEGPPEPSVIINSTCGILTALVYWVTSFNGGETQKFTVIFVKDRKEDKFETNVFSNAKGELKNISLTLSPGEYTFTILGENKYGSAISSITKSCFVNDVSIEGNDSVIAAGAGGGIGAAVVLIGIVTLILFIVKKRRIMKGKQDDGRKNLTDEDRDEDGLKDNPLYGTSQSCNVDSRSLYSQVDKAYTKEECNNDVTEQGPVYSQVQKSTNKGKPVKDSKQMKNMKTSGKKQKDIEMGTVYENSDDICKGKQKKEIYANTQSDNASKQPTKKNSYQPKKNKDGLIYADLELAPSGKRFVIRGIENRNNYAVIDLTKTAEPLPSDDENEEDEKSSQNMTANSE